MDETELFYNLLFIDFVNYFCHERKVLNEEIRVTKLISLKANLFTVSLKGLHIALQNYAVHSSTLNLSHTKAYRSMFLFTFH